VRRPPTASPSRPPASAATSWAPFPRTYCSPAKQSCTRARCAVVTTFTPTYATAPATVSTRNDVLWPRAAAVNAEAASRLPPAMNGLRPCRGVWRRSLQCPTTSGTANPAAEFTIITSPINAGALSDLGQEQRQIRRRHRPNETRADCRRGKSEQVRDPASRPKRQLQGARQPSRDSGSLVTAHPSTVDLGRLSRSLRESSYRPRVRVRWRAASLSVHWEYKGRIPKAPPAPSLSVHGKEERSRHVASGGPLPRLAAS
jgi:hypothetical protein